MRKDELFCLHSAIEAAVEAGSEEALKAAIPYWCENFSVYIVENALNEAGSDIKVEKFLPHAKE